METCSPKVTTKKFSYLENYLNNLKKKKGIVDKEKVKEKEKPVDEKRASNVAGSTTSLRSTTSTTSGRSTISSGSTYNYYNTYGKKRAPYGSTTSLPAITITQTLQRTSSLRSTGSLPTPKWPPSRQGSIDSTSSVNTPVLTRRSLFRQAREESKYQARSPSMFDLYKYRTMPARTHLHKSKNQLLTATPPATPPITRSKNQLLSATPPPTPPITQMKVSKNGVVCVLHAVCSLS